jgi:hypothetical protein
LNDRQVADLVNDEEQEADPFAQLATAASGRQGPRNDPDFPA